MDLGPNLILWPSDDYAAGQLLCVEFANTRDWRGRATPSEHLPSVESWLDWAKSNCAISSEAAAALSERALFHRDEAGAAFEQAIEFREALYNLLYAQCRGEEPPAKDRMVVQALCHRAMSHLQLCRRHQAWNLELAPQQSDWEAPLLAPALSAAQLLTGPFASRLGICKRDECRWLFLDLTKNHSRRWCSMQSCGNVVKARTSYRKKKASAHNERGLG